MLSDYNTINLETINKPQVKKKNSTTEITKKFLLKQLLRKTTV